MRMLLTLMTVGGMYTSLSSARIHTQKLKTDQILTVRTALGIATIIETPETIQSVITGDQSGFKIEYLDRAVTIKPLRFGARSNLYLQTASRRFDLRLETRSQELADYIVYLKTEELKAKVLWRVISKTASGKKLTLNCVRIARLPGGFLLLDLRLSSKEREKLSPEKIWIKQGVDSKIIHGLFLSKLEVSKKDRPLMIGLTLAKGDLLENRGIEVSIKGKDETVKLLLPAEVLWK